MKGEQRLINLRGYGKQPMLGVGTPEISVGLVIVGIVGLLIATLLFFGTPHSVNAGDGCVITDGGKVVETAAPGRNWVKLWENVNCITQRPQTYETVLPVDWNGDGTLTEDENERTENQSTAEYTSIAPDAGSNDPQKIVGVPYRLVFHIPEQMPEMVMSDTNNDSRVDTCLPRLIPDPNADPSDTVPAAADVSGAASPESVTIEDGATVAVPLVPVIVRDDNTRWVYENVKTSMDAIVRDVIEVQTVPVVKQVMQTYPADLLIGGDLTVPQTDITAQICGIFAGYGIQLDSFLLSRPKFNQPFEDLIEQQRLASESINLEAQNTQLAQQQGLTQAEQAESAAAAQLIQVNAEAEQGAVRAQAQVTNERIIAEGNAANHVITAQGQADAQLVTAQANAESVRLAGQAEADVILARGEAQGAALAAEVNALGGGDNYVAIQQAQAIGQWPITTVIGDTSGLFLHADATGAVFPGQAPANQAPPLLPVTEPAPEAATAG